MARSLKQKIEQADRFGYNASALAAYLEVCGLRGSAKGLQSVLEVSYQTAYHRYATGEFSRRELQTVQQKLQLTDEQMRIIFFNGEPGVFIRKYPEEKQIHKEHREGKNGEWKKASKKKRAEKRKQEKGGQSHRGGIIAP